MRVEDISIEGYFVIFFVGIAILLYVIFCMIKGDTYLTPRYTQGTTVNREDNPFEFWMIVGVFLVTGLFFVIISTVYIVLIK
jgi:hypothetical protein